MSPAQNPCTPHHAITLHHRIIPLHHTIASRHCITPSHYVTALHHCVITHEAPEAPPTPLGDITILYRSTTGPRDTLGRRYSPKTFPNSSARHPRATLCPFFVAGESALIPPRISSETPSAPLGDITSLYRSTTGPRDTLGRHYCPKTFPNRAVRYPWATLQAYIVPQQGRATPSGNTLSLFRRRNIRIDPVMNKPGDTFGNAYTLGRHYKPISFHNRAARHYRATFQPLNVPHQFCAAPLGNITAPKRSPSVLRGTLGQHFATFSSPKRTH